MPAHEIAYTATHGAVLAMSAENDGSGLSGASEVAVTRPDDNEAVIVKEPLVVVQ